MKGPTHAKGATVHDESIRHDGYQLGVDFILVLLVILQSQSVSALAIGEAQRRPTRFSLSNSISTTACFGLRCRLTNSRMYGVRDMMMERLWDAKAGGGDNVNCLAHQTSLRLTQMLRCDVLEPSGSHGTRP